MRRIVVTAALAFFLVGLPTHAPAQTWRGIESVRFSRYGVDEGLSQTTIRAMLQDKDGFIWLGTQDGLNRFDGYEFRTYRHDPDRLQTLGDSHIVALQQAATAGFWVGTQSGGIARYRPKQDDFQRYQADGKPGSLASNNIITMKLDGQNRLWVASGSGYLQWLIEGSNTFQRHAGVTPATMGQVRAIEPYRQGLLLGTRFGVIEVDVAGTQLRRWPGPHDGQFEAETITTSPDGREIWVGTVEDGVLRYSEAGVLLSQFSILNGLSNNSVKDLQFDRLGRLWIATVNGLSRLDAPSVPMKSWRYDQGLGGSLASSRMQSLLEDRDGLIWIGTWLNGVSLFIPRTEAFREIGAQPGNREALPGTAVPGLFVDNDSTLWLGVLEGGGLVHFDLHRGVLARYVNNPAQPDSLPAGAIQNIVRDRRGDLWVATGGGLAKLKPDGRGFEIFRNDVNDPESLPYNALQKLYVDSTGTLWIGTAGGGLSALCDGCRHFRNFPVVEQPGGAPSLGGDVVNTLLEDHQGALWIGLRPGGLIRYDRVSERWQHFRGAPGKPGALTHDTVTVIFEDSRHRLWIGTQGGGLNLLLRDAKGGFQFKAYTTKHGLGADLVGGIVEDAQGKLWISTTAGISRLDPITGKIESFGTRDGAQGLGYFVGAYGQLKDGQILFGGLRGVTIFRPSDIRSQSTPNRVNLTDVSIMGNVSSGASLGQSFTLFDDAEGHHLELGPEANDLRLEFSALSYTAPKTLHYAYLLQGVDRDWVGVDARHRSANYNNLKPGHYLFRVRARGQDGQWGEESQLKIHLSPPLWATTSAKFGYVLLALSIIGGSVWNLRRRWRQRRHAQLAIESSAERLKLALWGTGDELWDMDLLADRMDRSNPLLHIYTPGGDGDARATDLRSIVHPDDLGVFDQALRRHLEGESEFIDATYRVKGFDENWHWLRSRGRVVERDARGRALRLVGTSGDVTELKNHELALANMNVELENRVQERTAAMQQAYSQLQGTVDQLRQAQQQLVEAEKLAALGGLVAGVAHEINTPLGIGVTAASHLEEETRQLGQKMADGSLSQEQLSDFRQMAMDSAALILRNLKRADSLVKSFKQVAVDQSSEQRRTINLKSYLDEILMSLLPAIKKTPHQISVRCPEALTLETYPGAIYQIVVNLVMNSLLHAFEGITEGRIRLDVMIDGDDIVIDYYDNGNGMAEEVRRRVFDPFFTTSRAHGGSGLGMHIAWSLASNMLVGSLVCESAPGKGTRFRLSFPRVLPEAP